MARQQVYIAMIPVFIPVPKNDLKHQVEVGRALAEVIDTKDLSTIISLPGARFHPPKAGKDIITRWTSVEAPADAADEPVDVEAVTGEDTGEVAPVEYDGDLSGELYDTTPDEPIQQDEATTTGRRRRSAA